jgi:hypothetical protein
MLRVVLAVGIGVPVGCGESVGPLQAELDANRRLWAEVGFSDYRYNFQRLCFCVDVRPVDIEVRAGTITTVTVTETGERVNSADFGRFETVESLFDLVRDAIDRKAEKLTVAYHPSLGYPIDIDVDYSFNIADEEQRIVSSGLVPLGS